MRAKAGLVSVQVLAVDGSKVSANAGREATVDYERLAREVIEDACSVDAEEDERFGDRRGDDTRITCCPATTTSTAPEGVGIYTPRAARDDALAEQAPNTTHLHFPTTS
jgi:hypothetical protein